MPVTGSWKVGPIPHRQTPAPKGTASEGWPRSDPGRGNGAEQVRKQGRGGPTLPQERSAWAMGLSTNRCGQGVALVGEPYTSVSAGPMSFASRLLAYLQLCRAPNVFTAIADVVMAYSVARPTDQSWRRLGCLIAATTCCYLAGMVLNDVFDLEQDRRERPLRPLPSGRVPLRHAQVLGASMLAAGWLFSVLAGYIEPRPERVSWLAGAMGSALVLTILAYDAWLKPTWIGPWLMGACRSENILMGVAAAHVQGGGGWAVFSAGHAAVAAAIGLYVAGITWFARTEAQGGRRRLLVFGAAVMAIGWGTLCGIPFWLPDAAARRLTLGPLLLYWYLLLALLLLPVGRRVVRAIIEPTAPRVQQAVQFSIWSLIWWDAALLLLHPATRFHALAVLALFVPMILLGRWVYST